MREKIANALSEHYDAGAKADHAFRFAADAIIAALREPDDATIERVARATYHIGAATSAPWTDNQKSRFIGAARAAYAAIWEE